MEKEQAEVMEENGIVYRLAEDGCYYPDVGLPEGTNYNIGKYGLMRWEYLLTNRRREYIRLLLDGKLNEYLHEVDGRMPCKGGIACRADESRYRDYGGTKSCQSDEVGWAYK